MRRAKWYVLLLFGVAFAVGCGKTPEKQTESPPPKKTVKLMRTQWDYKPSDHGGQSEDLGPLSPAVIETLLRLKKTHNVTRDESWPGMGGVLGNDYFEIWYAEGRTSVTHAMRMMNDMMLARAGFERFFGMAPEERLVIVMAPYLEEYARWTGREYWFYSVIRSDTMTFSPLHVLVSREIDQYAVPHEYIQWAINRVTNYGSPRWLEEGVASYQTEEGELLRVQLKEFPEENYAMTPDRLEEILVWEESREESRIAYYHSYRIVQSLVDKFGEDKLKEVVTLLAQGYTMDEVCEQSFGMSYEETLGSATDYMVNMSID
jgi:hypothetical protein